MRVAEAWLQMIVAFGLDRNCLPLYGITVEPIVISSCILVSSVVWTWMAVRKMRSKPVVPSAGVVETVPALAFGLAVSWVALNFVLRLFPGWFANEASTAVTLTGIRQGVMLSGGVAFVLAAIYAAGNKTKQENELPALRAMSLGFLAFFASIGPVIIVLVVLRKLNPQEPTSHALLDFLRENRSHEAILWVSAAALVAAPLLEELLYRVILQGALRAHVSGNMSIAIVAVLFCAAHGWPNMVGLLPLAIVLGVLYDRTNSYLAIVTTHAAFNMCMLALAALGNISR